MKMQITRANVHDYNKIVAELYDAIKGYKSEWENKVPCAVMKKVWRTKIFKCYEQLESLGKS